MISRRTVLLGPIAFGVAPAVARAAAQPTQLRGLEAALALEHEAVHAVPSVGARLDDATKELAREIDAHHRVQRDRVSDALRAAGRTPPAALPSYAVRVPVVDRDTAVSALVLLEESLMRAYAEAVETEPASLRRLAAELLARCGTHATSLHIAWRRTLAGSTDAFPSRGH